VRSAALVLAIPCYGWPLPIDAPALPHDMRRHEGRHAAVLGCLFRGCLAALGLCTTVVAALMLCGVRLWAMAGSGHGHGDLNPCCWLWRGIGSRRYSLDH